jgi:ABC-2 type transport system ATP-binding protein
VEIAARGELLVSGTTGGSMIEAQGLRKSYGDQVALADVSFTVSEGERVGLLGLNGAGKSTLLRILIGALSPTTGKAQVAGHDIDRASLAARRSVGYLPETAPLYLELTAEEQLAFFARVRLRPPRRAQVQDALALAGVGERERSCPVGELSKGHRQRVALALALLGSPPVLILDEPTDGLDPAQRAEVRRLIRDLGGQHTVLLSTHVLSEVQQVCSRVLVLHRGSLVADFPAQAADLEQRFLEVARQ